MNFQESKKKQLSKIDKSNKKSWDEKIIGLCEKINKKSEYYTTSSCGGRIVLLKSEEGKKPDMFLFRTHNKISFNELKKILGNINYNGLVLFKQESCILHVACESLEDAWKLLRKAREVGWKRSGVMSIGGRIMCELHSTESLSLPIMDDGKILVDDDYLKLLVDEVNMRLEKCWEKIERLERFI